MTTHLPKLSTTFPSLLDEFFGQSDNSTPFFARSLSQFLDRIIDTDNNLRKEYGAKYFEKLSYPKLDIIQKKDKIDIYTEIPGLKKEDIELKLEENPVIEGKVLNDTVKLSICGKKQENTIEDGDLYLVKELKQSAFTRSIFLNKELVDIESYSATFNDGILNITFKLLKPKEEIEEKPKIKTLQIK